MNERVAAKMAEFVRGGPVFIGGVKEKPHGSPSTGSDDGQDAAVGDDFDPFLGEQDDVDGGTGGGSASLLSAPHENQ